MVMIDDKTQFIWLGPALQLDKVGDVRLRIGAGPRSWPGSDAGLAVDDETACWHRRPKLFLPDAAATLGSTDYLYGVSFLRYRPSNLALSCEVGPKGGFWAPDLEGDTPDFGHAFSKRSYFWTCGRLWFRKFRILLHCQASNMEVTNGTETEGGKGHWCQPYSVSLDWSMELGL